MNRKNITKSRFSLAAGILLLVVIPVIAVWVFGNAMISSYYERSVGQGITAVIDESGENDGRSILPVEAEPTKNMQRARSVLHVVLLFMILTLSLLIKEVDPWNRFAVSPVRFKLVLLLLYAVALPISGLLFFGIKYLGEYRELLTQEAYIACHSSITDLENGFEKEKAWLLKLFRSYKKMPEMLANPGMLFAKFKEMEAKRIQKWIEVRDINCEVLLTTQAKDVTEKLGVICKAIARLGINRFLSHRLDASQPQKLQAFEVLIQEFFESPLGGWARVFESPDELHSVSFGGFDIFYFWDIFEDPSVKPAFMIADQDTRSAIKKYLNESLGRRKTYGHDLMRMLAWSVQYANFMPGEPPEKDVITSFAKRVIEANAPLSTILTWQNSRWLAAGAPGKKLKNTILMSFFPVETIDRQIAAVRSDLFWGVALALILALLIGLMFARTLISPVTNLMQGVQALRRRDTSHRLEILQNDELGRLSATFNATSETLQDVLSAKTIQALLIPDQMPEIPGFSGDLINITAADLGGDYCDVIAVGADRWLLVIGDVTGHGVSSALVTAMTKAIVAEYARNTDLVLNDMFTCLNDMLFSQFKRKKCLTFFAALLNTVDNSIVCVDAGHPLPLLFGKSGLKEFPKQGCPPLGFSSGRKTFPQAQMTFEPGDCLVMYTDILIETRDRSGNPLGSKGFASLCEKYLTLPPAEMRARILEEVNELAGSQLEDDLTMIILRKIG